MAMITSGQREVVVNVVVSAARRASDEAINELSTSGVLTDSNSQRIVAQGDRIKAAVKAVVQKTLAELAGNIIGVLKRVVLDRTIELVETDGTGIIAGATDLFTGGVYGATRRRPCKPTAKTTVSVWQMIADGTYRTIFSGFGENLKRLCWTEAQIVALCRDHRELLRTHGYGTFFLFEGENGSFCVARVDVDGSGRLRVLVYSIDYDYVWGSRSQHHTIVPQL